MRQIYLECIISSVSVQSQLLILSHLLKLGKRFRGMVPILFWCLINLCLVIRNHSCHLVNSHLASRCRLRCMNLSARCLFQHKSLLRRYRRFSCAKFSGLQIGKDGTSLCVQWLINVVYDRDIWRPSRDHTISIEWLRLLLVHLASYFYLFLNTAIHRGVIWDSKLVLIVSKCAVVKEFCDCLHWYITMLLVLVLVLTLVPIDTSRALVSFIIFSWIECFEHIDRRNFICHFQRVSWWVELTSLPLILIHYDWLLDRMVYSDRKAGMQWWFW